MLCSRFYITSWFPGGVRSQGTILGAPGVPWHCLLVGNTCAGGTKVCTANGHANLRLLLSLSALLLFPDLLSCLGKVERSSSPPCVTTTA